jgi:hypothetical protein
MYIRKCWRETAVYFFFCLALSLSLTLLTMKDHGPNSAPSGNAMLAILEAWRELGFPTGLLVCVLGFRNIGTNISKGLGDFLLTRPRSRAYFVWAGWASGIAEVVCIVISMILLVVAILYQENGPFWRSLSTNVMIDQQAMTVDVSLLVASVLIFAVVAYSATYFVEVLTRGRSSILVLCLLFLYNSFTRRPGWIHSHLPSLLVRPYYAVIPEHLHSVEIYALIAWTLCALAFPIAAQIVIEHFDV